MTDTRSPSGRRTLLMAVRYLTDVRAIDQVKDRRDALGRWSRSVRRGEESESLGSVPSLRAARVPKAPPSWKPGRRCPTSACQPKELKSRPQEKSTMRERHLGAASNL